MKLHRGRRANLIEGWNVPLIQIRRVVHTTDIADGSFSPAQNGRKIFWFGATFNLPIEVYCE